MGSSMASLTSQSETPTKKLEWGKVRLVSKAAVPIRSDSTRASRLKAKLSTLTISTESNKPKPTYDPHQFWRIVFARYGSGIPSILPRALLLMPYTTGIALLNHYDCMGEFGFEAIQAPFTVMLGMLIAIRIGDAFRKWQRADDLMQGMHQSSRTAIGKMVAYLPPLTGGPEDERLVEAVLEVRRLLVLGCILIKIKIYEEKSDLAEQVACGLLLEEEQLLLTKKVATIADGPLGDGKKDRYPSQNRLAFAFQEAHKVNSGLQSDGAYNVPHTFMAVEAAITECSSLYEEFEHLHNTPIPLPYAQLVRLIALIFLLELPLATVAALSWGVLPLSFTANIVYFLTDACAAEMEQPFGRDANDVQVEKMVRRIDKHTACQVFLYTGAPVTNFNLFPESRTSGGKGKGSPPSAKGKDSEKNSSSSSLLDTGSTKSLVEPSDPACGPLRPGMLSRAPTQSLATYTKALANSVGSTSMAIGAALGREVGCFGSSATGTHEAQYMAAMELQRQLPSAGDLLEVEDKIVRIQARTRGQQARRRQLCSSSSAPAGADQAPPSLHV